jgi:hypothetical protein
MVEAKIQLRRFVANWPTGYSKRAKKVDLVGASACNYLLNKEVRYESREELKEHVGNKENGSLGFAGVNVGGGCRQSAGKL